MKKQLFTFLLIQSTITLSFISCKKDADTTAPVIVITGSETYQSALNATYTDQGATATDETDGNLTTKITYTSNVNKDLKGAYQVVYTVSDAAGNSATATRTVNVVNEAEFMAGTYLHAKDTCQTSPPSDFNATISTSNTENNKFTINNYGAFGTSVNIVGSISGTTLNIAGSQSLGASSSIITAAGTITSTSPLKFKILYTWTDGSNNETCTSYYSK